MTGEPDLIVQLKKLRYDLTAIQGRLTDTIELATRLNLPEPVQHLCPTCRLDLRSAAKLAEHVYISHDGPEPDHWTDAEARGEDHDAIDLVAQREAEQA